MKVGVIADTHGVLLTQAREALAGVDQIVHAGDVGGREVLLALKRIAPVTAVRGNYDPEGELDLLPDPALITLDGVSALLTHRMLMFEWNSGKAHFASMVAKFSGHPQLVIFGHTHFPVAEEVEGIYFLNPGYCGPDPKEWDPSVGILTLESGRISGEIIELKSRS